MELTPGHTSDDRQPDQPDGPEVYAARVVDQILEGRRAVYIRIGSLAATATSMGMPEGDFAAFKEALRRDWRFRGNDVNLYHFEILDSARPTLEDKIAAAGINTGQGGGLDHRRSKRNKQ